MKKEDDQKKYHSFDELQNKMERQVYEIKQDVEKKCKGTQDAGHRASLSLVKDMISDWFHRLLRKDTPPQMS